MVCNEVCDARVSVAHCRACASASRSMVGVATLRNRFATLFVVMVGCCGRDRDAVRAPALQRGILPNSIFVGDITMYGSRRETSGKRRSERT
ncbi:hypothetical protein BD410DRAFT_861433 [Rickenella mellea]|uniref:Uncharacterized protein n=1 Tax=Rickenella mellea TaxID=50990 RepID=A0A4Y7QM26_9AGAM|nr:hypothetical protein BD410DRAFT_861433 [Rickenella mellea]